MVDESLLNYDLLEALVVHIVQLQAAHGPAVLLQASSLALTTLHNLGAPCQAAGSTRLCSSASGRQTPTALLFTSCITVLYRV